MPILIGVSARAAMTNGEATPKPPNAAAPLRSERRFNREYGNGDAMEVPPEIRTIAIFLAPRSAILGRRGGALCSLILHIIAVLAQAATATAALNYRPFPG